MDYKSLYVDFLVKHFKLDELDKLDRPLKIICDASNGPAGLIVKDFNGKVGDKGLGLEVVTINDTPDPDFKAHGPNPLAEGATRELSFKVIETKADMGVIFDADGDRVFFVDDKGILVPSYITSILLFKNSPPPYVADELIYKALEYTKIIPQENIIPSKVGNYFVKKLMREHSASVGAEFSGHYFFKDFFGVDSGIFAMVQVANTLSQLIKQGMSLSEFRASLPVHDMVNEEMKLGDKKWADIEAKIEEYAQAKHINVIHREGTTLDAGTFWINMRPSNTEPILRLVGGGKKEDVVKLVEDLKQLV